MRVRVLFRSRRLIAPVLAAMLGTFTIAPCVSHASTKAPVVSTRSGDLQGMHDSGVDAFLGVPYAEPPVGPLRWRAPIAVKSWPGVRPANNFGPSCYQEWPAKPFGPYTSEFVDTPRHGEDCLYLNLWTPASRSAKLPVMVWIHGGGFGGGSGAVPIYNGAKLALQGAVVVTINYRVGPFGFLAHPDLSKEASGEGAGNYGLQDMIQALRWIRDNAEAFGGDAERVTIAGQSAGAMAVSFLIASPLAKGLFSRAIAQSGPGMGIPAIPLAQAQRNGERLAQLLGAATLTQLRALPPEKIQAAIPSYFSPPSAGSPPRIEFRPVLDDVVLDVDPIDGGRPIATRVPLITGFNADEFMPERDMSAADFEQFVISRYGAHARRLLELYPHANDVQAAQSARTLIRDVYMALVHSWAQRRTASGQRVYVYLFEHPTPGADSQRFGTFHTSEVPYLFGVLDRKARSYTEADERISAQLQAYWLNFLRTGNPNGEGLEQWQPVDERFVVMSLGDRVGPRTLVSSRARHQALLDFVAAGGRLSIR